MIVYVIMTTYVSKIGCIENDSQNPKLTQKSGKSLKKRFYFKGCFKMVAHNESILLSQ